jgi:hypothetical protein
MRPNFLLGLALLAAADPIATSARAQDRSTDSAPNNGQDITRPLHQLTVFQNYTTPSNGINSYTTTLRYERPFDLGSGWKFAYRFELPGVYSNDSRDNPLAYRAAYGDTLMQGVISKIIDDRQGVGFGLRFIAPSATDPAFGTGKWLMLPTVGYRYSLPEISNGSYFQLVARYRFDFAGDPTRSHLSDLQLAPSLNVVLPHSWYVTFFPSTDIRYNFMRREWFVPFDIEIGREISKSLQAGLELALPMLQGNFPVYKFKVEAHVTFLF